MFNDRIIRLLHRHNLLVITCAPLLAILTGTFLNIWYNQTNIYEKLQAQNLLGQFHTTVLVYNVLVYPALLYAWFGLIRFLKRVRNSLRAGEHVSDEDLSRARAKTINIPWFTAMLCAIGWLGCIPVFIVSLSLAADSLDNSIVMHLVISFVISGAICGTQAFFIAEICCLKLLYPEFFPAGQHVQAAGGIPGSLRIKWLVWVISTVVCPVSAQLLLFVAPEPRPPNLLQFALAVAVIFMAFSLLSAWLLARLIIKPIHQLRFAAKRVGEGNLETQVEVRRSDDFGMLISEFNRMVRGLKEKEKVQTLFGRHVGRQAAETILQNAGLSGVNREISVMFVDIRNFTSISESRRPEDVVELLNTFFQNMVEIVEDSGGLLNKFLGDGFMALFGAIEDASAQQNHADAAVDCATRMAKRLHEVNCHVSLDYDFAIGVGIHTGEAVVGSIGSQQRLEYTAIGDTVNVASRIEGLTKRFGKTILVSESTYRKLSGRRHEFDGPIEAEIRGKQETVTVYGIN